MADYLPLKPVHDRDSQIKTFADAVNHVYDAFKVGASGANNVTARLARRAVMEAYADLPKRHKWTWLRRRGFIRMVRQETAGKVNFDFATRVVTRTDTTDPWPEDVRFYNIEMGTGDSESVNASRYPIEKRLSDTEILLPPNAHPTEDVTGATYILYRSQYPLPFDFRKGAKFVEENWAYGSPRYVTPNRIVRADVQTLSDFHGEYTIRGSNEYQGRRIVEFSPPYFNEPRRYDFVYEARPREIAEFYTGPEYTEGKVNIASGTVTVTSSTATFTERMIGSILRLPFQEVSNVVPTGPGGGPLRDSPFPEQRVIMEVDTSSNELTLDAEVDGDYTTATHPDGVSYSIGDPLDLELDTMMTYFHHMSETKYARMASLFKDEVPARLALEQSALRSAIEEDYVTEYYDPEQRGPYYQFWNVRLQNDA